MKLLPKGTLCSTAEYQELLNKRYEGFVTVQGSYLNPQAVLQHHCNFCKGSFYAKPAHMLNSERFKHHCYITLRSLDRETSKQREKRLIGIERQKQAMQQNRVKTGVLRF